MPKCLYVLGLLCAAGVAVAAEDLEFRAPAAAGGAEMAAAMRSLAVRALPVYQNPNRAQFLTNLSALQMVAGEYPAADATRRSLEDVRAGGKPAQRIDMALIYDLYARARALAVKNHTPFEQTFPQVFRNAVSGLSDRDAYTLDEWLTTPLSVFQENLQTALERLRGQERISLGQAVDLTWTYLSFEAFRSFLPLTGPLIAEDDERRYIIDDNVSVRTPDHTSISAVVVRPRRASTPLPALLEFTAFVSPRNDAKESAAQGYAGIVAYTRGARPGAEVPVPYEHDGDDARAVIAWIAQQSWSDGHVGMYGTGYSAFAAWAAAKRPPPALKALVVASAAAPGIDPMRLDRIPGMPSALYRRWQKHTTFDRYWQQMMPYGKDFAHIDIPVLTVTGYYDQREPGALYYFTQHYRFDPHANDTLLIGPYDEQAMQRGPLPVLGGYAIDAAALIDLHELRYRWFDHVLRGGQNPDLLQNRVNFEVMGANEWRHADSLRSMSSSAARLYLDGVRRNDEYRLAGHEPPARRFIEQKITAGGQGSSPVAPAVLARTLEPRAALVFESGPLHRPLRLSGSVSGRLAFRANRSDLALEVAFYERLPSGEYFQLFAPPDGVCTSGAVERHPRVVAFKSDRLTSVQFPTGSRLVMVLGARWGAQHPESCAAQGGTGGPAPARSSARLDVRWYADSYIEIPISR